MAKITTRFDMEDKVTKKFKAMRGDLEGLDKVRKRLEKPMVLKAKDDATKKLRSISRFVKRDLAKTHKLIITVNDKASRPMRKINDYLKRRMPRTHNLIVRAKDRAMSVLEKINGYMSRHLTKARLLTIQARDKAMPTIHKIANYADRMLAKGYNFSVRAIDIASKTVGRIASYTGRTIPKVRNFTVGAIDKATRIVGNVKRALFTFPTMITVGLAVVGMGSLGKSTVGAAMNFEGYETSMEHWLGGNKKESQKLVKWMGDFADKTPFSSPDLFPALAQGVGLADGDVKQAKSLLEIASNMAALTPGRTVEDAMEALRGAKTGEFQMMKGYNVDINKESYDSMGGWESFIGTVDKQFKSGAEKFSQTASGQIATLKGYTSSILREAGVGILDSMKPRLNAITGWLDDNQDKWGEWKSTVQQAGIQGSEWVFSKLENGFNHIRTNYLENDEFKKLDFEGKVKFIMDDLGEWWSNTGRPLMAKVSKDVGSAIFEGMKWGIKEGIKGLGSMWMDAFKNPSVEGFAGAGIATAIAGSIASLVLSPLMKGIRGVGKVAGGIWGAGKKVSGFFGKGKGPKAPKPPKGNTGYRQPWFDKGAKTKLPKPNAFKNFSKLPKILKPLGKAGKFMKGIPILGPALGALTIATAGKGEMPGAVGSVGGGAGGALAGAAIGSVIPGIGTAIGGAIGGIAGSFGGGWLGDNWDTIKTKSKEAASSVSESFGNVKDAISDTLFSGEWWGGKWDSVKSWGSQKLSDTSEWWEGIKTSASETLFSSDWWFKQACFIYGYLEETLFSGEWWSDKWSSVMDITEGTIFHPDWWTEKWGSVMEWTSEKWNQANEIWENIKTSFSETVFNSEWWLGKWDSVMGWSQEKWDSAQVIWDSISTKIDETVFSSEWWGSKWDGVMEWTQTKWDGAVGIWTTVKEGITESLFSKDWWEGKWNNVLDWGKGILGGLGGWISGVIDDAKASFGKGRSKGNKTASKSVNTKKYAPPSLVKYAKGGMINQPHLGLVGEAGPEMIIPLSSGRRSRAMDLYNQTGQMLGVKPYAEGGQAGSVSASAGAMFNVGSVSIQGADSTAEEYGREFVQSIGSGINDKVVSIEEWKQNNIESPLETVVREASGFGSNTVRSFSSGQNNTPTGTRPYLVNNVHTPFNETKAKGSGWGTGTISEFVSGMRSKSASVTDAAKHLAKQVEKTFKEELGIASPSRVMAQLGRFASLGIVKGLGAVDVKQFAEKQAGSLAAAFSGMGAVGGNVKGWLQAAMMITGVPSSWLGPLSVIAQKESGGNPLAQNNWDINAKRGIPSKGLMQTIEPTFNAHKGKGMGNILNPIHNAVAAINYIKSRYGSIGNVPGIKSMARGGAYRGYWKGTNGPLRSGETAWVGERGPELVNLPRGSEVLSNTQSRRVSDEQVSAATNSGGGGGRISGKVRDIVLQITGDNNYYDDMDAVKVGKIAIEAIREELKREQFESGEAVFDG